MPIFEGAFQSIVDYTAITDVLVALPGLGRPYAIGVFCDFDNSTGITALRVQRTLQDADRAFGEMFACDMSGGSVVVYSPNLAAGETLLAPANTLNLGVEPVAGRVLVDPNIYAKDSPANLYDYYLWTGDFVCQWEIGTEAVEARTNGRPYYYIDQEYVGGDPDQDDRVLPPATIPVGQNLVLQGDVFGYGYALGTVVAWGPNVKVNRFQSSKQNIQPIFERFIPSDERTDQYAYERPPFIAVVRKRNAPVVSTATWTRFGNSAYILAESEGPIESYDSFQRYSGFKPVTEEIGGLCSPESDNTPGPRTSTFIARIELTASDDTLSNREQLNGVRGVAWDTDYTPPVEVVELQDRVYAGRERFSSIDETKVRWTVGGGVTKDPFENTSGFSGAVVGRYSSATRHIAARLLVGAPYCYASFSTPVVHQQLDPVFIEVTEAQRTYTPGDFPTKLSTLGGYVVRSVPAYFIHTYATFNDTETIRLMYRTTTETYQGVAVPGLTAGELAVIEAVI